MIAARSYPTIKDACLNKAQHIPSPQADLTVFEEGQHIPFSALRVFTVHAHEAVERGCHAHRECKQLIVCLAGTCNVVVDDGTERDTILLSNPREALFVPPLIWAEQSYLEAGTILMVLCDRHYEEADYIRNYDAFLAIRAETI